MQSTFSLRSLRDAGLSTQLTALLASLVLLITLVLAGVLGTLFSQRQQTDIGQQFLELAVQTTDKLDRSLFERFREVQILAKQPGLGSPHALDDKRRLLEDMQASYPYYAWLGLTDADGKVLVSANRLLEGVDVAARPWFRNTHKGIFLTDVHTAVMLAKLLPRAPGDDAPRFIDVAFPYRDAQGRLAGVFGVHLSLAWAADIEQSVMGPALKRKGIETLILDKDMKIVLGPQALVGTRLPLDRRPMHAGGYAVQDFGDGKIYVVGYSKMRGYGASPGLDWTVVVRQDRDLAYAPVTLLRRQIVLAGTCIALLFALAAWWIARRIARPIGAIAESARRIEAAESDQIADGAAGYREIRMLRASLQSLIGKLRANEASALQADRRKDEFLATLAHELRNPLAPISSAADLLRIGRANEAQQRRLGDMVARQTRHMTGLIDDLLDVARVTTGQITLDRQPVDMRDVAAEALEQTGPVFAAKEHRLETRLAQAPAMVSGDRKRLVQALANLLHNAATYTPAGGRIELSLEVRDGGIVVSVRDDGIGMSADLLAHVFELFTRETRKIDLSKGGLGVGLALSKRLVDQHGGTLAVRSAGLGQGSEFVMVLPALAEEVPRASAPAAPWPSSPSASSVLIVDDNADAAQILAMLVGSLGYDTRIAYDGETALDYARTALPAICLLDIGMPGMNGYALVRHLREIPGMRGALIVAVTGYGQADDRALALDSGFDDHMTKPVDLDRLLARLAAADPARAATVTNR